MSAPYDHFFQPIPVSCARAMHANLFDITPRRDRTTTLRLGAVDAALLLPDALSVLPPRLHSLRRPPSASQVVCPHEVHMMVDLTRPSQASSPRVIMYSNESI
jgi:hypothetical protein